MKRRLYKLQKIGIALLLLLVFSGCSMEKAETENTELENTEPEKTEPENTEQENTELKKAEPEDAELENAERAADWAWINSNIDGAVTAEMETSPKTDFALFVNKDWALQAEIRTGETATGTIQDAEALVKEQLIGLMTDSSLTGHDAELVRAVYQATTDWDKRNALSYEPWEHYLKSLQEAKKLSDLTDYMDSNPNSLELLNWVVDFSYNDGSLYVVDIRETEIMQFDPAEYQEQTEYGKQIAELNQKVSLFVLQKLGYSEKEAEAIFDSNIEFEKKLAASMYSLEEMDRADYLTRINNMLSLEELTSLAGNYPVCDRLRKFGADCADSYLVENPEHLKNLSSLWIEDNFEQIRNYLLVHDSWDLIGRTDRESYDYYMDLLSEFYGTDMSLTMEEQALSDVEAYAGLALNNLYIQTYVSKETKEQVTEIIQDVLQEYHRMLENEDWLSTESRNAAIEKLDKMVIHVAAPDELPDTSSYQFSGENNLVEISEIANEVNTKLYVRKINTRASREDWDLNNMNAYEVNAYYRPQSNSINIMNGILNGEIWNPKWSYERKLGGIGTVIGHEISHAFDAIGSQFDAEGNMKNWWSEKDAEIYQKRTQKLIDYFGALTPMGNEEYQDGERIKEEAAADITSMQVVLNIARNMDQFDYQKLFEEYAIIERQKRTKQAVYQLFCSNTHPLPYLRINCVVQQFDEFMDCYEVKPGDGMYLKKENRVLIW